MFSPKVIKIQRADHYNWIVMMIFIVVDIIENSKAKQSHISIYNFFFLDCFKYECQLLSTVVSLVQMLNHSKINCC